MLELILPTGGGGGGGGGPESGRELGGGGEQGGHTALRAVKFECVKHRERGI